MVLRPEIPLRHLECMDSSCSSNIHRYKTMANPTSRTVVATSEGSLNSDMSIVLFIGAISFTVLTVGYIIPGMRLTKLEMRLEICKASMRRMR